MKINNEKLAALRTMISKNMTEKRWVHTAEVEKMIERLCALYCPEKTMEMRAAALLHDITKELSNEEQVQLCKQLSLKVTDDDIRAPKTFHARTAAALIPKEFPEFSTQTIIQAVRYHTTGKKKMSITQNLLYLADYIDNSRKWEKCVCLRNYFWNAKPEDMTMEERILHLKRTLVISYNYTIDDLLAEGRPIAKDTVMARNSLLKEIEDMNG